MKPDYITPEFLNYFITSALAEDVGDGDHSTLAAIPEQAVSRARLLIKENGVIAGIELAQEIFHHVDKTLHVKNLLQEGDVVVNGDVAFTVEGSARSILTTERLVLNCMQRMSAIATKTRTEQLQTVSKTIKFHFQRCTRPQESRKSRNSDPRSVSNDAPTA